MESIDNSKKMGYPLAAPNTNYPLQATNKDSYMLSNIVTNKIAIGLELC